MNPDSVTPWKFEAGDQAAVVTFPIFHGEANTEIIGCQCDDGESKSAAFGILPGQAHEALFYPL